VSKKWNIVLAVLTPFSRSKERSDRKKKTAEGIRNRKAVLRCKGDCVMLNVMLNVMYLSDQVTVL
jgi:hypothetical protein